MWELLDVAIGNYNRGDEQAFRALFAQKAVPALTQRVYSSVYLGYYREVFGKIEGDAFLNAETVPDTGRGVLVLEAKSEKVPKVKVSCNFMLENGVMRIAQLRFEKL